MRHVAVSSLLLLSQCSGVPTKPVVEIGALDVPASQVICGLSDGSDALHREPIGTYDKGTCFKPEEWAKVQTYIHELEGYIERECAVPKDPRQ